MDYPESLYKNNREKLDKSCIKLLDNLYARHKPGYDWDEKEGLPDFSKIKIDPYNKEKNQSFNWDRFSEPKWVRYNIELVYQNEYAVIGYKVSSIRNINEINCDISNNLIDVEHDPIECNYSHCQLECMDDLKANNSRQLRNLLRMAIKHNAQVLFGPNEE